jgi:hypothetical protein
VPVSAEDDDRREGCDTARVWLFSSGPVGDPNGKLAQKMAVEPPMVADLVRRTGAIEHRSSQASSTIAA